MFAIRDRSLALLPVLGLSLLFALPAPPGAAEQFSGGRVIEPGRHGVLASRDRVEPENRMVVDRLENLLPRLMAETGIDLWLVMNREYGEDPVYFTLVPQPTFAARRTTILVFHRREDGTVSKQTVNRYPFGPPYEAAWTGGDLDEQWRALGELIGKLQPKRIGINVSRTWPEADGLTAGLHQRLLEVLPAGFKDRVVSAENLVVRWLETRSEQEIAVYPHIVAIARGVITEAFSSRVITPGVTTTDDVEWFIRERFEALGLHPWFMPSVDLQRAGTPCLPDTSSCGSEGVIQPGDVLHTDVGFCYLKLCTDTQENAYVAKLDEETLPAGLVAALTESNRWQDLLTAEFVTGRSGDETLRRARERMAREPWLGVNLYSHPIGFFGHGPGPTIGMWDNPGTNPGRGDWPLHANTAYAIEGALKVPVPEWQGQILHLKVEQTALFDGQRVIYLGGRQTTWHLVR
jgi:Xaa-Pro aminopeptidase